MYYSTAAGLSEAEIYLTMSGSCSKSLRLQEEINLFDDLATAYPSEVVSGNSSLCPLGSSHT